MSGSGFRYLLLLDLFRILVSKTFTKGLRELSGNPLHLVLVCLHVARLAALLALMPVDQHLVPDGVVLSAKLLSGVE